MQILLGAGLLLVTALILSVTVRWRRGFDTDRSGKELVPMLVAVAVTSLIAFGIGNMGVGAAGLSRQLSEVGLSGMAIAAAMLLVAGLVLRSAGRSARTPRGSAEIVRLPPQGAPQCAKPTGRRSRRKAA